MSRKWRLVIEKIKVKTNSIMPLMVRAFGVPIFSASAAKGTTLRGMAPNDIMTMLIILPRMSEVT